VANHQGRRHAGPGGAIGMILDNRNNLLKALDEGAKSDIREASNPGRMTPSGSLGGSASR
jgi:hypothetical protein